MPPIDRVLFFGTPSLAVPTLAALCEAGRTPRLVITQPARPAGRGQLLRQPPVAAWALDRGLPVDQPRSVRRKEFLEQMRGLEPDLAVVVAFGQIFPKELLEIPAYGCINLHASLLPRHRGAAPIQAAIAAGDRLTGVTTMLMDEGLDTGPWLLREEVEIGARETGGELGERLAVVGASLVLRTLDELEKGTVAPRVQEDERSTYAPMLEREDGRVDWSRSAVEIERRCRAFTPWPGCFTTLRGETLKIVRAEPSQAVPQRDAEPGSCLGVEGDDLLIRCGGTSVLGLRRVQRPGRRPVSGRDLANGMRITADDRLG